MKLGASTPKIFHFVLGKRPAGDIVGSGFSPDIPTRCGAQCGEPGELRFTMGLSYHYSLRAPAHATTADLAAFLENVEGDAKLLGFAPTIVVNGPFDTPERREFARRIARGRMIEDPRLRGVELPREVCWCHYPDTGECRLAPEYGVVLVLTDERGCESVFGFFRHPARIRDRADRVVMEVPDAGEWSSGTFIDSPDPRYRAIVRRFREAGYLASELDEFVPAERR